MDPISKKRFTIATNVLAWLALTSVVITFQLNAPGGTAFFIGSLITLLSLISLYYGFYFVFTPKLFLKRKYLWFGLSVIISLVFVGLVAEFAIGDPRAEAAEGARSMREMHQRARPGRLINPVHIVTVLLSGITILISVIARTANHMTEQDQRRKESERKQLETELSMLKNQVSPHFFFNTLNTVYALTKTDPEKAGEVVHQLSKMMRYLLYETENQPLALIGKEVDVIETYLNLIKVRLTDNVQVDFAVELKNKEFRIPALLFIPLIENAFKHGVSTASPSFVRIHLFVDQDGLMLEMSNSVHANISSLEKGGIGLANVKRRLGLMYEPNDYSFEIEHGADEYKLHLNLKKWL